MSRKDPPRLTDPYAFGSDPPPRPSGASKRASLPSAPEALPPPPRLPSHPNLPPPRAKSDPSLPQSPPEAHPGEATAPEPAAASGAKRRWKLLLAIAGVLTALTAGALGALWWWRARDKPIFAIDPGGYPESSILVGRNADGVTYFGIPERELPEQARWAELSDALCGGRNVFMALLYPTRRWAQRTIAEAVEDRRNQGRALACGRELAKHQKSRRRYWIALELKEPKRTTPVTSDNDAKTKRLLERAQVTLYEIDLAKLPETTKQYREHRDRGSLAETRCDHGRGDKRGDDDCESYAQASALVEGTSLWISGPLRDLEAFGKELSPKGGNDLDDDATWRAFGERFGRYPYAEIGTSKGFHLQALAGVGLSPLYAEDDDFESLRDRLIDTAGKYEVFWGMGDDVGFGGGDLVLELKARSESEAIDLLLDVKEWHEALVEYLDGHDEPPDRREDLKKVERDYYAAVDKAARRAIQGARIERDERIVTLALTIAYDDDERPRLEAMRDEARDRMATAAKIIDALVEGDKPDMELLRDLGGTDLVEAVKDPQKALENELKQP